LEGARKARTRCPVLSSQGITGLRTRFTRRRESTLGEVDIEVEWKQGARTSSWDELWRRILTAVKAQSEGPVERRRENDYGHK
jgi:hypothetical protein